VWMAPNWRSGHCLGWHAGRRADRVSLEHGGMLPGFASQAAIVPSAKLGMAVLLNAQPTNHPWGPDKAVQDALATLLPLIEPAPEVGPPSSAPEGWDRYVGLYDTGYWAIADIRLVGAKLYLATQGAKPGSEIELKHVEGTTFRLSSGQHFGEPVTFLLDDEGECMGYNSPGTNARRMDL
jgi:hypothetical protein